MEKLVLKLNIEKCKLYTWGKAVGLTITTVADQPPLLDSCPDHIRDLVRETLDMTLRLFTDTQKLKDRYGCKEFPLVQESSLALTRSNDFGPIDKLATCFSHFRVASQSPEKLAKSHVKDDVDHR